MDRIGSFLQRVIPEPNTGCWIWIGGSNMKGYGSMSMGKNERKPAHRFSYETFVEPVTDWSGYFCCHKCDNPWCVNPQHLFKGTHSENMKDCWNKGRHFYQRPDSKEIQVRHGKVFADFTKKHLSGSKNQRAKLTRENLSEIIDLLDAGLLYAEIGKRLGVSRTTIGYLVNGRTYKEEFKALLQMKGKPI